MKFTDEELSRILSCAAIKQLGPPSSAGWSACLIQAAKSTWDAGRFYTKFERGAASVFDTARHDPRLGRPDPESILDWMEKQGMA